MNKLLDQLEPGAEVAYSLLSQGDGDYTFASFYGEEAFKFSVLLLPSLGRVHSPDNPEGETRRINYSELIIPLSPAGFSRAKSRGFCNDGPTVQELLRRELEESERDESYAVGFVSPSDEVAVGICADVAKIHGFELTRVGLDDSRFVFLAQDFCRYFDINAIHKNDRLLDTLGLLIRMKYKALENWLDPISFRAKKTGQLCTGFHVELLRVLIEHVGMLSSPPHPISESTFKLCREAMLELLD